MWKLFLHTEKIQLGKLGLRFISANKYTLKNNNQLSECMKLSKNNNVNAFKRAFSTEVQKSPTKLSSLAKFGIGLTSFSFICITSKQIVQCRGTNSRLTGLRINESKNVDFDWKKFWSYLLPQMWYFIASIAAALVVAFLNIKIPQELGLAINVITKYTDGGLTSQFLEEMKIPSIRLAMMYLAQSTFTFFYIYLLSGIGERIAYRMKTDLFSSILKQDIKFFDEQRTGELINRLTVDIQDFKSSFKMCVSGGLRSGAQILGCVVSMILISPQMTGLTLMCVPTVIAIGSLAGSLLRNISQKAQAQIERATAVTEEAIGNIRTVRAFAMEDKEYEMFNVECEKARRLNEKLGLGIGLFQAGSNMFLNGIVLSTICVGGYLLSNSQLSAGDLMAFLMATQTIQRSLAQLSLLFGSVMKGMTAGSRVFEYINKEPTLPLKGGVILLQDSLKGNLMFKGVTFTYPARPEKKVLKDFDLTVPAGKMIALVGSSGSGKSTVVALLERFYEIDGGIITLDGHDIRTLDPSWLRENVLGLISQEPVLFATTIRENIRYGKISATDEEVENAAKQANADDFVKSFPQKYDTVVGERGATLSGGQKQRIAIARALLKNPTVLILDEATSALDTESEKIVQSALDKARTGRTVLVIAHRLSTIQNADVIVVLHDGQIVEMGTHETLKKLKGYYWSLIRQQQERKTASG